MPEHLRCFVERVRGGWKAYCVDVDLCASGSTPDEACAALDGLLDGYCYECEDGSTAAAPPRRASFGRRTRYWAARLLGHEGGAQARRCYDYHSPPQIVAGLS